MTDQLKNILIGIFVSVAITIGISMILFLEPRVGDGKEMIHVRFANISGINVGTRVTFGGKVVGEVSKISEVPNARDLAFDESGRVFLYELTLKLDSSVKMLDTDEIAIRTTGLMGERSIAINPKLTAQNSKPIGDKVLYANSVDPMDFTINQIGKVATRVQIAVDHIDNWFVENKKQLDESILSINEALKNVNKVSADIAQGNGTVGRFISSDDFYLRLSSMMGKVETLVHDVNHYGILFQYDKSWQRKRTKRANELHALEDPAAFRSYFETEVADIQTSLGRLTELLQRANNEQEKESILQSEVFKKDFAGLLRQVQALTESIKLYNEEFVIKTVD